MLTPGPIGVFDSGYGGLTIFKELVRQLPEYDYIYLGDNARTPYGNRSFETVYEYTLECVNQLFDKGCRLVILACNTASAKALRTIQQKDLPLKDPSLRVLGVIRPTTEVIGTYTRTGQVGIFATEGTVLSESYVVEINRFFPEVRVFQEACPMWVPLVENQELDNEGTHYFIKKHIHALLEQSENIDTVLLGCTHYPLLLPAISRFLPASVQVVTQGHIVAQRLADYLQRHPEMEHLCTKKGTRNFYTTDDPMVFNRRATLFFDTPVSSVHLSLSN